MRKPFRVILSWPLVFWSAAACLAWDRANPYVTLASDSMVGSVPARKISVPEEYEAQFQCLKIVNQNRSPEVTDLPDIQTTINPNWVNGSQAPTNPGGKAPKTGNHASKYKADYSTAWKISMPVEYEARFRCLKSVNPNRSPEVTDLPDFKTTTSPSRPNTSPSAFRADSRLTIFPSLKAYGLFGVEGKYTIHRWTSSPKPIFDDGISSALYPGIPPFERYYDNTVKLSSGDTTEMGRLEEFRLSLGDPEYGEFWVGSKALPSGVGATRGRDNASELLGLTIPWEKLTFTVGTGATLPHESSNKNMSKSILYGPLLAFGFAGACVLEMTYYAAVLWGVVNRVFDGSSNHSSPGDDDDSYSTRTTSSDSACASQERSCCENKSEKDSKGSSPLWLLISHSIHDLTNEYCITLGDRTPYDVITAEYAGQNFTTGFGVINYRNMDKSRPSIWSDRASDRNSDTGRLWWIYGKYRDDLFFANAEYSRFGWDAYPTGSPHDFRRGYLLFSEVGTFLGPTKASLMFALSSGHCLKESDPTERNWRHPINYQVMAPYESLMFHTFGGGNQTFFGPPARSHGLMSDAYAFGGRFDYSAAANLNLWTSYIWAHRLERYGTLFGQYSSTGRQATTAERRAFAQEAGRALVAWPDNYGYVSDGFIGQELNIGADWRLTERLNLSLQWAYWQPGKWFSEAHQAQTVTATGLPTSTGVMETRPAIHGFHGSFVVKF